MYIDYLYVIIVLPCIIFALIAQGAVSSTFSKYSKEMTRAGITGFESARMVLDTHGLYNVRIEKISGTLTDHYDPRSNVIRLSDSVYSSTSPAAVGVAAHEAGHAVQYAEKYFPVRIRSAIIPATNFCSRWSTFLIIFGLIFLYTSKIALLFMLIGIVFFAVSTIFQLITLPVEFNASRRAMTSLESSARFDSQELSAARKVLTAAAMTYVAALAVSLATLLRYVLIFMSGNRRRR